MAKPKSLRAGISKVNLPALREQLRRTIYEYSGHGGQDYASWNDQEGVLLTLREARLFLALLETRAPSPAPAGEDAANPAAKGKG